MRYFKSLFCQRCAAAATAATAAGIAGVFNTRPASWLKYNIMENKYGSSYHIVP